MSDANGSGPGRRSPGGGPPDGPPPGPLSGPAPTPPRRRTWLLGLAGALVLAVGVAGLLVGTGAFEDDGGGGGAAPASPSARTASATAPPSQSPAREATTPPPESAGLLSFGRTHRFAGGVEVTVSPPERFAPAQSSAGHKDGNIAVKVDVTVRNGSDERLELVTVVVRGRDGDGRETAQVFDPEQVVMPLDGDLLPGRRTVAAYGFDLPPGAGNSLEVGVSVGSDGDAVHWDGELP
ncbi:DUF4352 domain-containing protein [Streptomyces sp. NPDC007945]|uniref:DUF4352 domain-containing protein n=1 Tax=Streptomyces sp. NPDC007945 TaxID=3364797 RepID=UPI0036E7727D